MSSMTTDNPAVMTSREPEHAPTSNRWAWWGVAAGILGFVATDATTSGTTRKNVDPSILATVKSGSYHVGGALGYVTVACLLVLAAAWRTHMCRRMPDGVAVRVVADGLTASAAALTLGYGWRLAMALYLPGGVNGDQFSDQARWIYYVLNDFGSFLGWLGVVVAAGAMVWLGLREKVVSNWIGIVSVIPVLATLVMAMVLAIAGFPGVVGPVWLIVAFAGIALSRTSRVTAS